MTPDITTLVLLAFKLLFLVAILVYIIFAVVMVRQERLMADVLEESFEPILRLLTWIHLSAAVGVFLLALILL